MDWKAIIQELLYTIITAIIPIISYHVVRFLRSSFSKLKVSTDQLVLSNTINETLDLIISVVDSTSQTYVDELKKSGTFTKESQAEAFMKSKEIILNLMSSESKSIISSAYTDLDKWIEVQIETAVRSQKINTTGEGE